MFSNCDEVALYYNDELVAVQGHDETMWGPHGDTSESGSPGSGAGKEISTENLEHPPVTFDLSAYTAGEGTLRAVGLIDGEEAVEYVRKAPGEAASVQLRPQDDSALKLDGSDARLVWIDIADADGNLTLDTDAALKAAEFVYSLKTEGVISDSCVSRDSSSVSDDFEAGDVAMFVSSSVTASNFTEAGVNWDYIPFTTDVTGGTMVTNDSLVLMSGSKNKEAAISLMKELTSVDMMEAFHADCYQMPPISVDEQYLDDPKFESMYTEYADQFHALPVMKNFSQIESALYANLQQMMMDEMSPEEALQKTMEYTASLS